MEKFSRLELLINKEQFNKLQNSKVLVFGLGGVGGYVTEGLVRSGIGSLTLVDYDHITLSNFNRQIIADETSLGELKTVAFSKRIRQIDPNCQVETVSDFILPETLTELDFKSYDYIIDAIDTVATKLAIIEKAKREEIAIISAMGFGNKLDPGKIKIGDISETAICPLAKVMRRELRKRNIENVTVAYSTEVPLRPLESQQNDNGKITVGSFAPVVATAGFAIAAYVINDMIVTDH